MIRWAADRLRGSARMPVLLRVFRAQWSEMKIVFVAFWLLLVIILVANWFDVVRMGGAADPRDVWSVAAWTVALPLFIRSQLSVCRGGAVLKASWLPMVLIAMGLIPMFFGVWNAVLVFGMVAVFNQFPVKWASLVSLVAVVAFVGCYPAIQSDIKESLPVALVDLVVFTMAFGSVTRLAVLLDELRFAGEALARRRVDVERERVGRDLHDIMGRTLVAASLRNQTLLRSVGEDPELEEQLEQVHRLVSHGQTRLRALTSGPAITQLDDEFRNAESLCSRVGVSVGVERRGVVPPSQEMVVGLVLREAITNVLKHSHASRCQIQLITEGRETIVRVTNNGTIGHVRNGMRFDSRLVSAVAAVGGSTDTRFTNDWFCVTVQLPVPAGVRG